MKKVLCGYENCDQRRIHWERPEENRPHQTIEVTDDFNEKVQKTYGAMSIRQEKKI